MATNPAQRQWDLNTERLSAIIRPDASSAMWPAQMDKAQPTGTSPGTYPLGNSKLRSYA